MTEPLIDLQLRADRLSDEALLQVATAERDKYTPESMAKVLAELQQRGIKDITIERYQKVKAGSPAIDDAPATAAEAKLPLSIRSKVLLGAGLVYAICGRLKVGPPYNLTLGMGLISVVFWSMAWDARESPRSTADGIVEEPKMPRRLVVMATIASILTIILAWRELR
jgi:hypothetical protein